MKILTKLGIFSLIISGFLIWAAVPAPALAATPFLSIAGLGNNLVQISITNANPYSQISLYEQQQNSSLWTVINNLGTTDGNGSFNQQTGIGANVTNSYMTAYVVVGGLQSNTVTVNPYGGGCVYNGYSNCGGCTYNCGGGLNLSQTSVSLGIGQTASVTVQNNSGTLYVSNNSNQSVVSATASYNSVSFYGIMAGSATVTICGNGYGQCASVYVTVSGNLYGGGSVTFSQSNLNLSQNQSATVYVYGNSNYANSFYVSNNSNNNSVIATLSGNVLSLTGYNGGSSTITVCQQSGGGCGSLYVIVGGGSSNSVTFSQNNLVMTAGQTSTVYIYGYGGFYISGTSNGSVATAAVNNNVLTITAIGSGNTVFTVCQNNNNTCGSLSVAVSGYNYGYGGGNISFSQNNPSLTVGQSQNVTIYGNAPFYVSSNSNPGAVSASVSGNIVTLYGNASGSSTITICASGYNYGYNYGSSTGCGTLYATVNGYNYGYGGSGYGSISVSQSSVTVAPGQSVSVAVSGNGPFYLSANGTSNVASGVMTGNTLNIYGSNPGSATITVCQNYNSGCANVMVTVTGNYGSGGSGVLGSSIYANGQLVSINGTVYIVYQNTLTAFANAQAFLGLGFSFSNVYPINYPSGMTISGYVISSAYVAHPWGSWIRSGQAIYFVSQYGLIPVPDWNTFISNGGQANMVVNANSWDFQVPMLSPMVYGDSRLR